MKAPPTRASHDWQSSKEGAVRVDLDRTMRADRDVTGLAAGPRDLFRFQTLTKDGGAEYTKVATPLVE